jgi:hypothetical protein
METNEAPESTTDGEHNELVVVMDGYGGDWTPSAVLSSWEEATKLKEMLSKDAQATCSTPSWYTTIEDARNNDSSLPPTDLPDELIVCFKDDTAIAVSNSESPIREFQISEGGLRATVTVFETADAVAQEKPSVKGQFIEATNTTADDLIGSIE